jgi:K+-transporting ATPase ATPase C chain
MNVIRESLMSRQLRPLIVSFVLLTLLTGAVYPAAVTLIAWICFPDKATGSVVVINGRSVGAALIGQQFTEPKYFWPRPSATSPAPYAGQAGSGSNLAPTNPAFADAVKSRIAALHAADPENRSPIPVDLVAASGSGLDPHISTAAAQYQAPRIARARQMPIDSVLLLIERFTEDPFMGIGEPRVNVLKLNLALDQRSEDNTR